jgi:hypothetical protein
MLAYMMVHKGPTPNFLDPFLYGALCRGLHNVKSEVCNVQDVDIREQLQKVKECKIQIPVQSIQNLDLHSFLL